MDGTVAAFDDTSLDQLWKINIGSAFSFRFPVFGGSWLAGFPYIVESFLRLQHGAQSTGRARLLPPG
jgi:hypothetical protein